MKTTSKIVFAVSTLLTVSYLGATPFKPVTKLEVNSGSAVYKVGNPYTQNGINYTPKEDNSYDEIGIASWYGDQFNGKKTANGEVFDKNLVTVAHSTLPMPSIVEITNLDNGRKVLARVNDRGPYAPGRIVDVSEEAAVILGFKDKGTANVRVRIIPQLSKEVAAEMSNYKTASVDTPAAAPAPVEVAKNEASAAVVTPVAAKETSKPVAKAEEAPVAKEADANITPVDYTGDDDDVVASNAEVKTQPVSVNANKLKQVNLSEPDSIQKYVPRGVFVQVGAFSNNNNNLKRSISSLSQVGVVTLQNIDLDGQKILRVRVGPYGSINDAVKVKSSLVQLGYKDPKIVVEE